MTKYYNRTSEKPKRRRHRRTMPDAEVILWSHIRSRQLQEFKFRRQHSIGPYLLDFYCPEVKLAVELDGDSGGSGDARATPPNPPLPRGGKRGGTRRVVRRGSCRGITLVEMLVAMAITLVMMAAVVTVFDQIGQGVNDSRSTLEMSARLRNTRNRLQNDLASLTAPVQPSIRPESGLGYFEYHEGPHADAWVDLDASGTPTAGDRLPTSLVDVNGVYSVEYIGSNPASLVDFSTLGDYDDILMFTIRSQGEPFVGRMGTATIESQLAEVIWYAVENPPDGSLGEPGLRTIYRRVLLVAPWAELSGAPPDATYYHEFDVASRVVLGEAPGGGGTSPMRIPSSLADLSKRENRFGHLGGPEGFNVNRFPHAIDVFAIHPLLNLGGSSSLLRPFGYAGDDDRLGEDVMLSNVLAFDVRAYDHEAPIYNVVSGGDQSPVEPGDPGWYAAVAGGSTPVSQGAYVDLAYGGASPLGLAPNPVSGLAFPTYDTWPIHYEHDGLDQFGDGTTDTGTNGLDDDGQFGVDDMGERETGPPYNVPLRGIEVRIRVYEPDSRQIREVKVRQSFVAE